MATPSFWARLVPARTAQPSAREMLSASTLAVCVLASGCGEAQHPRALAAVRTGTRAAAGPTARIRSTPAPARSAPRRNAVVARVDASSDKVLAEGKVHIAAGAPSDTEIKREIELARKAGIKLPKGESAASFENAPSNSAAGPVQVEIAVASWNPRSKPIATWIIPILEWASQHGWSGTVTSGYRTYYEQAQLNAAGLFSAPAGLSNHEKSVYPGGAVDVTSPGQLIAVLRSYTGPVMLIGGVLGAVDPEHFSATGD